MDQKNFLSQALGFIQAQRHHRWWLRAVTGMAAVVVFVTPYLLILPANTMENSTFEVTASPLEASLGETINTDVFAAADDGREETFFALSADGDNAGLDEGQFDFDRDGIAVITDQNGQNVKLHREYTEDGEVHYWFTLSEGQSASFSLPWVNGMDRYRSEVTEEEVPVQPDEPPIEDTVLDETPEDPVEAPPPETGAVPNEPSGETTSSEQMEEPATNVPEQNDSDATVPVLE